MYTSHKIYTISRWRKKNQTHTHSTTNKQRDTRYSSHNFILNFLLFGHLLYVCYNVICVFLFLLPKRTIVIMIINVKSAQFICGTFFSSVFIYIYSVSSNFDIFTTKGFKSKSPMIEKWTHLSSIGMDFSFHISLLKRLFVGVCFFLSVRSLSIHLFLSACSLAVMNVNEIDIKWK